MGETAYVLAGIVAPKLGVSHNRRMAEIWDEYRAAKGKLYVDEPRLDWRLSHLSAAEVRVQVLGCDSTHDIFVVLQRSIRDFPSGNMSLMWRGRRLIGVDLDGPSHLRVKTPHRHTLGTPEAEPVDLKALNLQDYCQVARWFVKSLGIQWRFDCADPVFQSVQRPDGFRPKWKKGRKVRK